MSEQSLMLEQRSILLTAYARSLGLRTACPSNGTISGSLGDDLNDIIASIEPIVGDIAQKLRLPEKLFWGQKIERDRYCDALVLNSRVSQLISFFEHVYHLNSTIVEIGSLYNSIKDPDLKSRCNDLLSAPGNFDRAINQATLVLEDRLRKVSKIDKDLSGANLVNAVINTVPQKGLIRVSPNDDEHEGIGHICRGLMFAFRNPTHHHLSDSYSREDALKLCAFIDNLLSTVENAEMIQK